MSYFPLADYWWFYLAFTGFVMALLALDLGVFHRKAHAVSLREASVWSVIWVGLALAFNFTFYQYAAWKFARDPRLLQIPGFDPESASRQMGLEFLTGYVVEKTLSLDNIFVFVVVFSFFAIPAIYQHRVLFYWDSRRIGFSRHLHCLGISTTAVSLGHSALRRFVDSYRAEDDVCSGQEDRSGAKPLDPAISTIRPRDVRTPWATLLRTSEWCAVRYTFVPGPAFCRDQRHHIRDRFCTCDLRSDTRTHDRFHFERVRDPWSAVPLFSTRGSGRTLRLVEVRPGAGTDLCRFENGLAERCLWRKVSHRLVLGNYWLSDCRINRLLDAGNPRRNSRNIETYELIACGFSSNGLSIFEESR